MKEERGLAATTLQGPFSGIASHRHIFQTEITEFMLSPIPLYS
jgi:hypothetical protein